MTLVGVGSIIVGKPHLPSTAVDEDLVVLHLATNNYVGFDAIGRRIWEMIAQPTPVDSLCRALAAQFSGPADAIQSDVIAFLNELCEDGLVDVVKC